jgi:hypothetical protein
MYIRRDLIAYHIAEKSDVVTLFYRVPREKRAIAHKSGGLLAGYEWGLIDVNSFGTAAVLRFPKPGDSVVRALGVFSSLISTSLPPSAL